MTDRHEHLDEGTIHAWLDDALPPDEAARLESLAGSCEECAAVVAEARGLIAASSRILFSLDAVPAGVIPGTGENVDQLAALRARQRASSRRWWQDRRVMVAASLVFVAGVSSLVWRTTPNDMTSPVQFTTESDSAPAAPPPVPVPTPAAPAPVATRESQARDAIAEQSAPRSDAARARVSAAPPVDTPVVQKAVAEATRAPAAPPAANEARVTDVASASRRSGDSVAAANFAIQRPLRQEGTRQAVQQQLQSDTARLGRLRSSGLRLSDVVVTGAGAAMADSAGPFASCYRLRPVSVTTGSVVVIADSVKLLNETIPMRSDPSWFRAQSYGAVRDTTLAWRQVDSVTVELRAQLGADSVGVRFTTNSTIPAHLPRNIMPVMAGRVLCP